MKYTALSYSVTVYSTQLLSDSTHHSVTQWQDAELSWSVTVYSNHSITVHSTQSLSDSIQHSVAQWQYTALSHSKTEYSTQHSVTQWQNTALIRTVTVYNTQSFSDSIHLVYSELFTDCPYKQVLSISIKLSTLCHSFFSDTAPVYLSDLLHVYSPSRQLRSSSDSRTLCILHTKIKTYGQSSFSHAAPSVWNSLPHDIRHIQSVTAFKTALKTHLFKSYLF